MRRNFFNKCREYGISDDVIRTTLQNTSNIYVGQPTSWAYQAVETLKRISGIREDKFVENYQFKALHDALLYGINKASLSDETINGFRNYLLKYNVNINYDEIDTVLRNINSSNLDDVDQGYKDFANLSTENQKAVIVNLLLDEENIDGLTLTLVSNARKGKSLLDVYQKLINDYEDYDGSDVSSEVYIKPLQTLMDNLNKHFSNEEDFNKMLSEIKFDDVDLSKNQSLFDDIYLFGSSNPKFSRDNKFLKEVIDAFQLMETAKQLRADSKELENRIKDVLIGNGFNMYSRAGYISSIKKRNTRYDNRSIFFNLLEAKGIDIRTLKTKLNKEIEGDTLKNDDLSKALPEIFSLLSSAATSYGKDLQEKNRYDETIQRMSLPDKIEVLLSSGKENIMKYLSKADNIGWFKEKDFRQYKQPQISQSAYLQDPWNP